MQKLAVEYVSEIKRTDEFKKLVELKKKIDTKYFKLILAFKTTESEYLEAKKYEGYQDIEGIRKRFVEAKKALYSKEEVIAYFQLEREIQNQIDKDMDDLKKSISNKFSDGKCFTL